MSTAQWILNVALLGWVLSRNVGTRRLTRGWFAVPAVIVVAVGAFYLRHIPTAGNDLALAWTGFGAGVLLGVVAAALTRVYRQEGALVVRAGAAFATVWVIVIGGRIAFAEWATHSGAAAVGQFSMRHNITGADAWTAAFVLMAVAMVLARSAATLLVMGVRHRLWAPVRTDLAS